MQKGIEYARGMDMKRINGKELDDAAMVLVERNTAFYILSAYNEQWMKEHPEFMDEPYKERKLIPIDELPKHFMDSTNSRFIWTWDETCSYFNQFDYFALFEGFDANTVTVGRHGDLDVKICTDGSIVMLDFQP